MRMQEEEYTSGERTSEEELLTSSPRRFWELIEHEGAALLLLNVAFVITCIPLVTVPPAIYALHVVVRGMLDGKAGKVGAYLTELRKGWRRGWGAFLLVAVPGLAAGYGMSFYLRLAAKNWLFFLPFMLCSTVFIATLLASVYLYRLLANGNRLTKETVRLALLFGLGRPLRALLAAAWYYVPLALAVLCFPLSGMYLFVIGFSAPCLLGNLVLRKVLALDEGRIPRN